MSEDSFVLVSNIPPSLHTSDLRKFFTDFVETEKFTCFHFRHRPEKGKVSESGGGRAPGDSRELSYSARTCSRVHSAQNGQTGERVSNCCIVQLSPRHVSQFLSKYHRKHWLDSQEEEMAACCFVSKVKMPDWATEENPAADNSETVTYVRSELMSLPELKPPNLMPRGNVGTSTKYFLQAIKECRLPARLVGKLKLEFPQSRNRKFGQVPFDYNDGVGVGRGCVGAQLVCPHHVCTQFLGPQLAGSHHNVSQCGVPQYVGV